MHELPKNLTIERAAQGEPKDTADLEKGSDGYGDKKFDQALNDTEDSQMLPLWSPRDKDPVQKKEDTSNDDLEFERRYQYLRFDEDDPYKAGPSRINTGVIAGKRQAHFPSQTAKKKSKPLASPLNDLDPVAERLARNLTPLSSEDFCQQLGLKPPTLDNDDPRQLAQPHGLYAKIVKQTRRTHRKYLAFATALYIFILLQMMISVVFIILGPLHKENTFIVFTVLGAVSLVMIGGLALMHGQRLPSTLRLERDLLRSVRFEAEMLYSDMRSGHPVLYRDVKKLREDFLRVLEQQRNKHPDVWVSSAKDVAQGAGRAVEDVEYDIPAAPEDIEPPRDPHPSSKIDDQPFHPPPGPLGGGVRPALSIESISTAPWTNSIPTNPSSPSLAAQDSGVRNSRSF